MKKPKIFVGLVVLALLLTAGASVVAAHAPLVSADPDLDVGVHGWNYILGTMVAHPQDNALISVLIPSMMTAEGYDFADLVAAAGYAGPSDAKLEPLSSVARNHAGRGANALVYVPEATYTAGHVPVEETLYLEQYLRQFVGVAVENGYIPAYGPGLSLVSDPETWRYGAHYDLQVQRIGNLARMMPDNAFWILRMNTPEHMYRNNVPAFGQAVQEYVSAVHAGNPTLRIILHLSCMPGTEDQFLAFVNASRPYIDQAYAGPDYPFPSDPEYDVPGTTATMVEILQRTGAGSVSPTPTRVIRPTATPTRLRPTATPTRLRPTATPIRPTATPTRVPPTATPVPGAQVYYNLSYGPDERHVVDLYLPQGAPGRVPVVAWFHGGGLTSGDKKMVREQATLLAKKGFAVVAANYRLRSQVPPNYLPAQVHDAKAVIRWIRANADKYGLNPYRIGSIGGSAGAFLSTNLGTSGNVAELEGNVGPHLAYSSRVQASVGLAGVYDWFHYYEGKIATCKNLPIGDPRCQEDLMFMCGLNEPACLNRLRQASAKTYVSRDDGPSLIVIGDQDETPGGLEDHRLYDAALDAAGVDSTLIIVPGAQHSELWPDIAPTLVDFFTRHLMPAR
ncbi:MAG TPA: alpha/beta hydrolase [Anaerolineae bacterium]|nr:alpha/beta hydrolase [Anaerolineae bacterium]